MPIRLPRALHPWPLTPRTAIALQKRLASRVLIGPPSGSVRWVAGLDAAFARQGTVCLAAVVLWDLDRQEMVELHFAQRPVRLPYVPGLLSFREGPALLAALRRLSRAPDVLMCDGQGIAHPRRFGVACHMGVLTDLPSVGCAKSVLVGHHLPLDSAAGAFRPLLDGDDQVGDAVRTREGVRPVYVSVGHRLDQATARSLVFRSTLRHRLPEPTRLADKLVGRRRQQIGS